MDKLVRIYMQPYKYKWKITIEIDLTCKQIRNGGFYKVFRLYTMTYDKLYKAGKQVRKVSLQYNHKHVLQLECESILDFDDMISELIELGYCELIKVESRR